MSTAYFYQNSSTKGQGWFICKATCIWLLFNSKNVKSRNYKATLFIWQGQVFLGNWIKPLINSILFIGSIFLSLLTSDMHLYSALCTMSPVRGLLAGPRACTCSGVGGTAVHAVWPQIHPSAPGHFGSEPWPGVQQAPQIQLQQFKILAGVTAPQIKWSGRLWACKANPVNINHHQA